MAKILVIDDEKDIVDAIGYNLIKEGFNVSSSFDGIKGLQAVKKERPDLIILDLMLPGISGTQVCRSLKSDSSTAGIPVIMLSAKSAEADKVQGLETGADDYMTKPFSIKELIARIRTVLKRCKKSDNASTVLKLPSLEIDPEKHTVKACGKETGLTAKEFALLEFLARNADKVYSREKLLDTVWGIDVAIETRTVDVHIRKLREKLGKASGYVKTVHGVGYKYSLKE